MRCSPPHPSLVQGWAPSLQIQLLNEWMSSDSLIQTAGGSFSESVLRSWTPQYCLPQPSLQPWLSHSFKKNASVCHKAQEPGRGPASPTPCVSCPPTSPLAPSPGLTSRLLLPSLPAPQAAGYITGDSALFMTTDYFLILRLRYLLSFWGLWCGGGACVDCDS